MIKFAFRDRAELREADERWLAPRRRALKVGNGSEADVGPASEAGHSTPPEAHLLKDLPSLFQALDPLGGAPRQEWQRVSQHLDAVVLTCETTWVRGRKADLRVGRSRLDGRPHMFYLCSRVRRSCPRRS